MVLRRTCSLIQSALFATMVVIFCGMYVKLHSFKKKVDAIFRAPHQLQLFYFISFFLNSVVKEAA